MADEVAELAGVAATEADGKGDTGATAEAAATEAVEAPVIPEKYEFNVPEGFSLDDTAKDRVSALAKDFGLPQDKAQKLVDSYVEHSKAVQEKQKQEWSGVREKWVKEITDDKEFGGERLTETVERAKRALDKFGSDSFKSFLEASGYGDNPEIVKFLARVDKAVSEDRHVDGAGAEDRSKDPASIIYPNQGK